MTELIIRILLADDHKVLRDGLRVLLEDEGDMEVIGEASTGDEAVRLTTDLSPDVVVMDLGMPGGSGLDVIKTLREKEIPVHIIVGNYPFKAGKLSKGQFTREKKIVHS